MAGHGVVIQLAERADEFGSKRIQVDVADQFSEVLVFITHDALVPILKEMAVAVVAAIVVLGIAREKAPHQGWQPDGPAPEEEVGVIRH
jgi:hypothetical protein